MKNVFLTIIFISLFGSSGRSQNSQQKVMDGFPPSRESLVTPSNYRQHPFSQWGFRNAGAHLNVVMMPRSGAVHAFRESTNVSIGKIIVADTEGNSKTLC
jgi:hypothetical protein